MERAVPGLREAEVGPDRHEEGGRTPYETRVAFDVPGLWIHEVLLQGTSYDTAEGRGIAGQADCLLNVSDLVYKDLRGLLPFDAVWLNPSQLVKPSRVGLLRAGR